MKPHKIVKIRYLGKLPTVDIEVDSPNHLFYGNGIATSNSHSVGYAKSSYHSAYFKAHFPLEFFAGFLSSMKKHDVPLLVEDAKYFGIKTVKPDLRNLHEIPFIKDGIIYLSVGNIKGLGEATFEEIQEIFKNGVSKWSDFVVLYSGIGRKKAEGLIKGGSLDYLGLSRKRMLYELGRWFELSKTVQKTLVERYKETPQNLLDFLKTNGKLKKEGGVVHSSKGMVKYLDCIKLLESPPHNLEDTPNEIAGYERELFGISLTNDKLDGYNLHGVNTSCVELKHGKYCKESLMAVEILNVYTNEIKSGANKGKLYAKLTIRDQTGEFEIPVFSKEYEQCKSQIYIGNMCLMRVDSLFNNNGYKVSKICPIE